LAFARAVHAAFANSDTSNEALRAAVLQVFCEYRAQLRGQRAVGRWARRSSKDWRLRWTYP